MKTFKKGFTLVELLVVVALGATLLTLTFINVNKNREQTRDKIRVADIQSIRLALEEYRANCGQYPQDIYGSDEKKSNGCAAGITLDDFLAELPVDPETGEDYKYIGLQNVPGFDGDGAYCYDYHIAAELESSDIYYFDMDHDADKDVQKCNGAQSQDWDGDDADGWFDFRSTNS